MEDIRTLAIIQEPYKDKLGMNYSFLICLRGSAALTYTGFEGGELISNQEPLMDRREGSHNS